MKPSWKEISRSVGLILLFGVIAFNLYSQNGLLVSLFRGIIVYLVFSILNEIVIYLIARMLNDYELRRLREQAEQKEQEEQARLEGGGTGE